MKKVFIFAKAACSLVAAIFRWMKKDLIRSDRPGQSLPPIRYDGDPKDIYLA